MTAASAASGSDTRPTSTSRAAANRPSVSRAPSGSNASATPTSASSAMRRRGGRARRSRLGRPGRAWHFDGDERRKMRTSSTPSTNGKKPGPGRPKLPKSSSRPPARRRARARTAPAPRRLRPRRNDTEKTASRHLRRGPVDRSVHAGRPMPASGAHGARPFRGLMSGLAFLLQAEVRHDLASFVSSLAISLANSSDGR